MTGSIVQINISRGGMPKLPIPEGYVTPLGIEGDLHARPHIHGGPRQALLLICSEVIDQLIAEGYPLYYGALGENLTTRGIDRRIGQIHPNRAAYPIRGDIEIEPPPRLVGQGHSDAVHRARLVFPDRGGDPCGGHR